MNTKEKARVFLLNAELQEFKDDNGKDVVMTKIQYCSDAEESENYIGFGITKKCFRRGNKLKDLKPFIKKYSTVEFKNVETENGYKQTIVKVENQEI